MKTLQQKIQSTCIYFDGISNKTCKAGIEYDSVRVPDVRPFQWPCINTGGNCDQCRFPSQEAVAEEINAMEEMAIKNLGALVAVKKQITDTGEPNGSVPCNACTGNIIYRSASNGHIRAKCNSCGMGWME